MSRGFVLAGAQGGDQTEPAADFALAQNREAMPDGMDFRSEAECGGIQVAQEAVAEGSFALDDVFNFLDLDLVARGGLQESEIVDLIFGNLACVHKLGAAEEIALEIEEAGLDAGTEVVAGLNFLGQHAAGGAAEVANQSGLLGRRGAL